MVSSTSHKLNVDMPAGTTRGVRAAARRLSIGEIAGTHGSLAVRWMR
jgi:hypothetical protein